MNFYNFHINGRMPDFGEAWLFTASDRADVAGLLGNDLLTNPKVIIHPAPTSEEGEWLVMRRPIVTNPDAAYYIAARIDYDLPWQLERINEKLKEVADINPPEIDILDPIVTNQKYCSHSAETCCENPEPFVGEYSANDYSSAPIPLGKRISQAFENLFYREIDEDEADLVEEEETGDATLDLEQKKWLDAMTALVLDYVTRHHKMPPIEKINAHLAGKISFAKEGVSPVVVNGDLRVILPDYNELELRMTPLVRTLYILFLMHPEGIRLKDIGDYTRELGEIYMLVKPGADEKIARRSIRDLTMPGGDSLRQKINLAKRAVGRYLLNPVVASHYVITGERGNSYKIAGFPDLKVQLPRILKEL